MSFSSQLPPKPDPNQSMYSSNKNSFSILAKGDSAASGHYFTKADAIKTLDNITNDSTAPSVLLPNATFLHSNQGGQLPDPTGQLSTQGKKTVIFNNLHSSLISLGQLCDDNCEVNLNKNSLKVYKNKQIIMQGKRSTSGDKLWDIPIPTTTSPTTPTIPKVHPHSLNVIIRKDKSKHDFIQYLHAACFSPTKTTFLQAIKINHLQTFPGLTADLVNKHLIDTVHTAKGHMNQTASGLQSTKQLSSTQPQIPDKMHSTNDFCPVPNDPNTKTRDVIFSIVDTHDKAFLDLTGRFPHCSSRGNQYILIGYHYDSNAIIGAPLKNRQAATITTAWKELNNKLSKVGEANNLWILDNEASDTLKQAMTKYNETFQLVPPHTHQANTAERAIQTFKNHFKAGLTSLNPDFPVTEWDRLLNQAFLTLNLLRSARVNPSLSAYAFIWQL